MQKILLPLGAAALLAAGCKTTKTVTDAPVTMEPTEFTQLDTMVISADAVPAAPEDYELPVYRAEQDRPNDLKHTELHVGFDWAKEQVIGQAILTFSPTFYPQNSVQLDAKNFEVKEVRLNGKTGPALQYDYDGRVIDVKLDRTYTRDQEYRVYVDYTAIPQVEGGSAAITSDKGLFFIDPRDEDPDKPSQIWTQGETEHNSNWMPTIDQPNERATQEFHITVQDKYKTLSNGLLVSSQPAGNGMRTDRWRMDTPHAPYLHMIAVGDFAKVDDTWEGMPLAYYVEPEYEPYAKEIFAHTPEMLTFFSELTGVRYPWPKYSQVVVRDYVSGAMENTTAVIFGEFVQKTDRELADDNNDLIVAHEMFHHWFGDYVTCESWSNLTLNEGFANYSEYLWFEHHDGLDYAEDHRLTELEGYLQSATGGGAHPLIWYQWDSNEDMFDAHSYNKGGLVLHMLRGMLGDEAFFASLKEYLTDNALSAVEVDELRIAFEDVTGQDLQWFFDQWFLGNGHPEYTVSYGYSDGEATVTVEQTQDPEDFRPIFILPTKIGVYPATGEPTFHEVRMDKRKQTFSVPAAEGDLVVFDPESRILGARTEQRGLATQKKIVERVPDYRQRLFAARTISNAAAEGRYVPDAAIGDRIMADPFYRVRNNGINLADTEDEAVVERLKKIAREDSEANVRSNALRRLGELERPELAQFYMDILDVDDNYLVMTTGLQGLFKVNPTEALARAEKLEDSDSEALIGGVATVYATSGDPSKLAFFERKIDKIDNEMSGEFAGAYLGLAFQNGPESTAKAIEALGSRAANQKTSLWRRFGFARALGELKAVVTSEEIAEQPGMRDVAAALTSQLDKIKAAETNPQLQMIFSQM